MHRSPAFLLALSVGFASAATACGTPGELGQGTFWYECNGDPDLDIACYYSGDRRDIPDRLAVGAYFVVSFTPDSASADQTDIHVVAASAERMQAERPGFTMLDDGVHSLLARSEASGEVIDYVDISGSRTEDVEVSMSPCCAETASLDLVELLVGGTLEMTAGAPIDVDGLRLAGSVSYAWTTDDPSTLLLQPSGNGRTVTVTGQAVGSAPLQLTASGFKRTFTVTVQDQP